MIACKAPGPTCGQTAVDEVEIVSPVAMALHGRFPVCAFHLRVYEALSWEVQPVPRAVAAPALEGWAPGEIQEAYGR